jgi:uncharacterized damage-inducible protein DinB
MGLIAATVMVLFSTAAFGQAPRPPQTMSMFLQGQYANLKRNLAGAAEKMPAEHFSFRPTPEVRTYAELFAHTIDTQIYFCNLMKGGVNPIAGKNLERSVTDKAGVVQMVKDGFAYCDEVFASLSEEKLAAMLTLGVAPKTYQAAAGNQAAMVVVHGNEHYGNLVTYMRIKGIVPPSSAQ